MTTIFHKKLMMLLLTVLLLLTLVACNNAATDSGTAKRETEATVTESESQKTSETDGQGSLSDKPGAIAGGQGPDDPSDIDSDFDWSDRNAQRGGKTGQDTTVASSATIETQIDPTELFSNRDLTQTPDLTDAETISLQSNKTIDITEEGVYVLTGNATNCTVRVEADSKAKVQLVFDGVNITNEDFPAIYVVSADKCFLTLSGSNSISVTGTFQSDGDTNTDAVIFSKDDLVLNGTGSLTLTSKKGNGVSCKDDLKITGGTYNVTTALDSFEANDSIAIKDGTFIINSGKDGLHSENDEDNTVGWIYIGGGSFTITAKSDGIQAATLAQFDGGTVKITGSEAIEATIVTINDGNFDLYGSDDGINASRKSTAAGTPTITINSGYVKVAVGQGDTDALDANGAIYVNGGTIDVTAGMSSFDYDSMAEFNGGTIIINGVEVNSIPRSAMGRGGQGGFGGQGGQGGFDGGQGGFGGGQGGFGGQGNAPDGRGGRGGRH